MSLMLPKEIIGAWAVEVVCRGTVTRSECLKVMARGHDRIPDIPLPLRSAIGWVAGIELRDHRFGS